MPTGGVESTEASLRSWFDAGVTCVGMGSNLITKELLKAQDYHGIAANVRAARELNPKISILTRATYLKESEDLRKAGANAVFASEGEIALSMTAFLLRELGASDEQIDRERNRVREELFV